MFHLNSKIRKKEKTTGKIHRLFATTLWEIHILASLSHGDIFIVLVFVVILYYDVYCSMIIVLIV